jgi:hypothetical protein
MLCPARCPLEAEAPYFDNGVSGIPLFDVAARAA